MVVVAVEVDKGATVEHGVEEVAPGAERSTEGEGGGVVAGEGGEYEAESDEHTGAVCVDEGGVGQEGRGVGMYEPLACETVGRLDREGGVWELAMRGLPGR